MQKIDLVGKTFGQLLVIRELPERDKHNKIVWECRCSCGNLTKDTAQNLRKRRKSCGCAYVKHGFAKQSGNGHYFRWQNIKARCSNPKAPNYHRYGGRGITMYGPWVDDFLSFKTWIDDNLGPCPEGHSLDRIDNGGNYEPGNLRWATCVQQNANKG